MRTEGRNDGLGLIAQLAQAALALDASGDIEFANGSAAALLGREPAAVRGRPLFEFITAARDRGLPSSRALSFPARATEPVDDETVFLRVPDADARPVDVHLTAEQRGRRFMLLRDVSEREHTYGALRDDPAVVDDDGRAARVGLWEWDILANEVRWSTELFRIHGIEPHSVTPSYEHFLGFVHPDDRASVDARNRKAFADHQPFKDIKRVVRADGLRIEMRTQGEVVLDAAGTPIRMFGACEDISDVREAARELAHVA